MEEVKIRIIGDSRNGWIVVTEHTFQNGATRRTESDRVEELFQAERAMEIIADGYSGIGLDDWGQFTGGASYIILHRNRDILRMQGTPVI